MSVILQTSMGLSISFPGAMPDSFAFSSPVCSTKQPAPYNMPKAPGVAIPGDHHIHTRFCNHAKGEMEEYVLSAINKGLSAMTFLEHLEIGITYSRQTWLTPELFRKYFREGQRLQQQYDGRIRIRLGVEVGYNPEAVAQLQKMITSFPFEHIGLSYHFIRRGNRHLNLLSRRKENINALLEAGTETLLNDYFQGLINACNHIPCDKVCHLDAALRYLSEISFTTHHLELINKLLQTMQRLNIALEINTAGFDIRSSPYPSSTIINQARSLNIPLIAGSDAHHPDQVARHFNLLGNSFH